MVHRKLTNCILKRGSYIFGQDYKLIPGSFRAAQKRKKRSAIEREKKRKKTILAALLLVAIVCAFAVLRSVRRSSGSRDSDSVDEIAEIEDNISGNIKDVE